MIASKTTGVLPPIKLTHTHNNEQDFVLVHYAFATKKFLSLRLT